MVDKFDAALSEVAQDQLARFLQALSSIANRHPETAARLAQEACGMIAKAARKPETE